MPRNSVARFYEGGVDGGGGSSLSMYSLKIHGPVKLFGTYIAGYQHFKSTQNIMYASNFILSLAERQIDFSPEFMDPAHVTAVCQIATQTVRNQCAYLMIPGSDGSSVFIYRPEAIRRIPVGLLEQLGDWYINKPNHPENSK